MAALLGNVAGLETTHKHGCHGTLQRTLSGPQLLFAGAACPNPAHPARRAVYDEKGSPYQPAPGTALYKDIRDTLVSSVPLQAYWLLPPKPLWWQYPLVEVGVGGSRLCLLRPAMMHQPTLACHAACPQGHGSHTAGTVGAAGNNGVGVAGMNWKASQQCCALLYRHPASLFPLPPRPRMLISAYS